MGMNAVSISGNLGADPELRYTAAHDPVLTFSIAVNDRVRNPKTGEWVDRPNWIKCTVFGKRAESLAGILTKGFKVGVEGKLRQRTRERDGANYSEVCVIVDELEFFSGARQNQSSVGSQEAMAEASYHDDIPF